jgi:hypothetical protein
VSAVFRSEAGRVLLAGSAEPARTERWRAAPPPGGPAAHIAEETVRLVEVVRAACTRLAADWAGTWAGGAATPPPEPAGGLLLVFLQPPPELAAEMAEWYDTEHLPALGAVPGVLAVQRYLSDGGGPMSLALYHLAGPEVVAGAAWRAASATPWTLRLRDRWLAASRLVAIPA